MQDKIFWNYRNYPLFEKYIANLLICVFYLKLWNLMRTCLLRNGCMKIIYCSAKISNGCWYAWNSGTNLINYRVNSVLYIFYQIHFHWILKFRMLVLNAFKFRLTLSRWSMLFLFLTSFFLTFVPIFTHFTFRLKRLIIFDLIFTFLFACKLT